VPTESLTQQRLACLSGSERRRPGWFLDMKYQTCIPIHTMGVISCTSITVAYYMPPEIPARTKFVVPKDLLHSHTLTGPEAASHGPRQMP